MLPPTPTTAPVTPGPAATKDLLVLGIGQSAEIAPATTLRLNRIAGDSRQRRLNPDDVVVEVEALDDLPPPDPALPAAGAARAAAPAGPPAPAAPGLLAAKAPGRIATEPAAG